MLESLINIDESLFQFINQSMSNPVFDAILVPLRHKLFWIPLYLFLLLFISINFNKQRWFIYIALGICILTSDTMSSKIIKENVVRTRPCNIEYLNTISRVPCSPGYSFTSSHATNHFALGTYFFLLFAFTKWRYAFILWASIISFAQVYVGQHFPVDVIGGAILGSIIGIIIFSGYRMVIKKTGKQ